MDLTRRFESSGVVETLSGLNLNVGLLEKKNNNQSNPKLKVKLLLEQCVA
jgi:hypothetical protein